MNIAVARKLLAEFDLKRLFVEELNWHNTRRPPISVRLDDVTYTLTPISELGGMVVLECTPQPDGMIPDRNQRRAISRLIAPQVYEHIVFFVDSGRSKAICAWPKRSSHKFIGLRETTYTQGSSGDVLLQKLNDLNFEFEELNEEGDVSVTTIRKRAERAFDVEPVVKRFYEEFRIHHDAFRKLIRGIQKLEDQHWYTSVMLNRLMFIYFIQRKSFLDNDPNYLHNRLRASQAAGRDKFYRRFLIPLFFKGFATRMENRDEETNRLLGKIPFLNGGLFLPHQIEKQHGVTADGGGDLDIPDQAFSEIFSFFDKWEWHLDVRENRPGNEINPDVLGYIFEKYINAIQPGEQKAKGAYYTREDITGYISRNTIIPFIFDTAQKECPDGFKGEQSVWKLLREDPDRYIYPAVRTGVIDEKGNVIPESALPDFVQRGMHNPKERMFDKRYNLMEAELIDDQGRNLTLPTETWREYVERRTRCLELRSKLAAGEIQSIDDLITYNLDICQFAEDTIRQCESPELLRAFWKAIENITVLDPTCGSGAFLFAALNVLGPLYEACLDRMRYFLMQIKRSGEKHRPEKLSHFRKVLDLADNREKHPNRAYFVYKSIILHNLYGVDIMEEVVEICKLRLFLKLVAQVDKDNSKPNLGIEPLPDIDFNIRAGNTLVGFVTQESVRAAAEVATDGQRKMLSEKEKDALDRIEEKAEIADRASQKFREMQEDSGMDAAAFAEAKLELQNRLSELDTALNQYLAAEYGVDAADKEKYEKWLNSHQPFHWFVQFHRILARGGFDVIIGNPPYVEYRSINGQYVLHHYETETCGNLYAFVIERCLDIVGPAGRLSMIVQLPIVCTERMIPLQRMCLLHGHYTWFSTFDGRPGRLFEGLQHIRACIFILKKSLQTKLCRHIFVTNYNRWYAKSRWYLFETLNFVHLMVNPLLGAIPKIGSPIALGILKRMLSTAQRLPLTGRYNIYYHNAVQYWIHAMDFVPYFWNERDGEQVSTQVKHLPVATPEQAAALAGTLNSSLFYWWFIVLSDCRHLNVREIERFPLDLDNLPAEIQKGLADAATQLMYDFRRHSQRKKCYYKTTGQVVYDEFYPKHSKPIIDKIDCLLAKYYGFTDEELDFIINYDIKYRMGLGDKAEEEETM